MTDATLVDTLARAVAAAEQLATARREILAELAARHMARQRANGAARATTALRIGQFDKEISAFLAGAGFLAPFYGHARPSRVRFTDATCQGWRPRRDVDTPDAFLTRWRTLIARDRRR
jgi:hypothetical protein